MCPKMLFYLMATYIGEDLPVDAILFTEKSRMKQEDFTVQYPTFPGATWSTTSFLSTCEFSKEDISLDWRAVHV
jgi:hypothetical protein